MATARNWTYPDRHHSGFYETVSVSLARLHGHAQEDRSRQPDCWRPCLSNLGEPQGEPGGGQGISKQGPVRPRARMKSGWAKRCGGSWYVVETRPSIRPSQVSKSIIAGTRAAREQASARRRRDSTSAARAVDRHCANERHQPKATDQRVQAGMSARCTRPGPHLGASKPRQEAVEP
jgi:hypothetical protein